MKKIEGIENSQGRIYYGMHFYPGVAEYQEPDGEAFRVYLNEQTLRKMDPTFAGRPIFVEHVDDVSTSIDKLREEADGWVIESFFNAADGKHWVKFIIVSERAERAIQQGMRLSNAYLPKTYSQGGLWNGVSYSREITDGEYEHLAIVSNPRYDESIILTPEQFKKYNNDKTIELQKIANSKNGKGEEGMKLNFFKREKVENALDLEKTLVELPKSKKEMSISDLVAEMDKVMNMQGYANGDHMVKVGEDEMTVNDLVKKHMSAIEEIEKAKMKHAEEGDALDNDDDEKDTVEEGMKDVDGRGGDKSLENEDKDESAEDDKEEEDKKAMKKQNAREKAKALKNAGPSKANEIATRIYTGFDGAAKGKARYGSAK